MPEHILTTKGMMPKPETLAGASIPEYIEVKTATGNTVAFLSPESDDVVAWIDDEQNGSCTIEIELPATNEKWQYLTDKYRIYADNKEFVILNPDAVDKQRDGKKIKGKIKAHESWVLLGKKFPTISNDPQNLNPPWGAVIIVSGGAAHGGFDPGSAGSALSYLLNGTGWTVDTVDITGTFDLETEKESVLYNINQVQEKWGGVLVWDSVDKTVSLRDEATYQPYTGYQIRYAKNLKGISRVDDYDIVTRLYPFGENDLNIANVNGGLLYLDNQSYSTEVLEGVWYNQDLADQNQLKAQGEKQLAVMCRPRHNYKTEVLDLRSLPGYGHETFKRSDMVDLLDEDFGANARVRIIRYRHNVFQPWLCDMELGDPLEKIAASVAQTVLMAKFYKNVVAPNTSFQNLLKAIINTEATEINGASGDYTLIDGVSTWKDPDTGDLTRATPKGFIISSDGGQTWKTAISGKGIHADAGWVGKLNAGVVTVGAETAFEEGYDPTKITADSVGMGVDADCLGLWHFDGSLNSHKGVAVDSDGAFGDGCFGQALNIATGKKLKAPTTGMDASAGTINFRAKNLSVSANGSVLVDVPDNVGNQGMLCGIASDGRLFIEDAKLQFTAFETSQADFNTGTLSGVAATSAGNLELARTGTDFTYAETTQADFETGTLSDVVATSAGDLEIVAASSGYGSDVCTGGTAISGGDYIGAPANNAFDNDESSWWLSSQHGSGISGVAYIGYDLGAGIAKHIRRICMKHHGTEWAITSGKVQRSSDGVTWIDVATITMSTTAGWETFDLSASGASRYWRILANANLAGGQRLWTEYEIEMMEYVTTYKTSGSRIKEIDLSGSNPAGSTKIEWLKTTPTGTAVKVETALSLDGGSTYGAWQVATSGQTIPGITAGTNLSNARLKIRETLSTTDTSVTPKLHSLNLYVYGSYKSSGYRYKIYDISAAGSVGSSKISWEENKPVNTTLTVKAAISTDGGLTYGAWQNCTNSNPIPGLTQSMDISNARLKVQEDLATSDGTVTPQLQELTIDVGSNVQTVYGPNKSTLTAWDSISLAWKSDRLSLVVNDAEACYIENPGLPTAFGSHVFIGTDRNSANAINTLVDELRIDKVYRDADVRTGWHKMGVPFYTSEDMKQWPGYLRAETDGLKVYDSENALRVLVGSWIKDAIRKYGIKIIDGEIYSSYFSTRKEGEGAEAGSGAEIDTNGDITIYDFRGEKGLKVAGSGGQGAVYWFLDGKLSASAYINPVIDAKDLYISTSRMDELGGIILASYSGPSIKIGSGGSRKVEISGYDEVIINSGTKITLKRGNNTIELEAGETVCSKNLVFSNSACGPVIKSPNGTEWRIKVDDNGNISTF